MKKMFCLLVCVFLCNVGFSAERTFGGSVGMRLSVLGMEPTASFIFSQMELEASAPLSASGGTSKDNPSKFGVMPGGSFGYLQEPFKTGWQNGVGIDYHWLSPSWWEATLIGSLMKKSDISPNFHAVSLYYKGGWKWSNGCNLYFRLLLPLVFWGPTSDGSVKSLSVINTTGLAASFLALVVTPSLGFRWCF